MLRRKHTLTYVFVFDISTQLRYHFDIENVISSYHANETRIFIFECRSVEIKVYRIWQNQIKEDKNIFGKL